MTLNPEQLTEWYTQNDTEVCLDCKKLAGKKMLLKEWLEKGIQPGEAHTKCGENCRCLLGPAGMTTDSVIEFIAKSYTDNMFAPILNAPKSEMEVKMDSKEWHDDMNMLNELENRKIRKDADLELYCDELLLIGCKMTYPGELQIGYWINRLTIKYVRLKEWAKAKKWIEQFFSLPEQYRTRSNSSEQKVLQKRLDRCNKMLST